MENDLSFGVVGGGEVPAAPDLAGDVVEAEVVWGSDEGLGPGLAVVLELESAELVDDLGLAESLAERVFDQVQVLGSDGERRRRRRR